MLSFLCNDLDAALLAQSRPETTQFLFIFILALPHWLLLLLSQFRTHWWLLLLFVYQLNVNLLVSCRGGLRGWWGWGWGVRWRAITVVVVNFEVRWISSMDLVTASEGFFVNLQSIRIKRDTGTAATKLKDKELEALLHTKLWAKICKKDRDASSLRAGAGEISTSIWWSWFGFERGN